MKTLMVFLALTVWAQAEDWTVGTKTYQNVTVGLVEADKVHITYTGGIGMIMLADLDPNLQKRFGYDPAKARVAVEKRDADQKAAIQSYTSVDSERTQLQAAESKQEARTQLQPQAPASIGASPAPATQGLTATQRDAIKIQIASLQAEVAFMEKEEAKVDQGSHYQVVKADHNVTTPGAYTAMIAEDLAQIDQLKEQLQ